MQTVPCPVCESDLMLDEDDMTLHAHVYCGECGSVLEVVKESPIVLEALEDEDDDDFDDDDFDDEDDDDF